MKRNIYSVLQVFVVSFLSASLIFSVSDKAVAITAAVPPEPSGVSSQFKLVSIPAPSLAGNLVGQSTQRDLQVYLPKQYFTTNTPMPVVYYLPGFGDATMLDINAPSDLDEALKTQRPTIIVIVSGVNRFYGSFYANSSVTGNWADFVSKDVVAYMDANYRTIPKNTARGIAGHSMGGYGALDLAMRHPEIFGSVFAISPGLVNANGMAETQMFDSEAHIKSFIAAISHVDTLEALERTNDYFDFAYGMAFAPINTPPFFEYPYQLVNEQLVRNDAVWAKWESGFGNVHSEIVAFASNLSTFNGGLGLDCGTNDEYQWIARGCTYYDAQLSAAGIAHTYTTHSGMHQDRLRERILTVMLPFFSTQFDRGARIHRRCEMKRACK